jgi:hypothetical protein
MTKHINIPTATAQSFIAGAPDAKPAEAVSGKKVEQKPISLKMPTDLLAKIDAAAKAVSLSRASFIKMHMTAIVSRD